MNKRKILYFFLFSFLATGVTSLFFFNDGIKKDSDTGIIVGAICFTLSVFGVAYALIGIDKESARELP